jgi:hypothetical protein
MFENDKKLVGAPNYISDILFSDVSFVSCKYTKDELRKLSSFIRYHYP